MLRVKLRQMLAERPEDLPLMLRGTELIVRAVGARHRMSPQRRDELVDHLRGVIDSLADQLLPGRARDD